ncbi:MAG: Nif3-like dinuclear metal center hexameric protein [Gemmatimonadetes bacterium]|nr:Nif3-like dinuclear metal center hexameric protein [Gemmatimonadota bacterium]
MSAPVELQTVAGYLDGYLRVREVPDEPGAVNGLQVENSGLVGGFVAAVDASQATIDGVIEACSRFAPPPLLLVHHGLFWDGNIPVTDRRYRRLAGLLRADVPLYSAHIPLDVHGEVGNNAVLAASLGLTECQPFDSYRGAALGICGLAPGGLHRDRLVELLDTSLGTVARLIPGGPPIVRRVGIITGGAGSRIGAARDAGLDTFVTGEGAHQTYFDAMEFGVNVIYAGHYATEQVGVKALALHLATRFNLPWEFHHHPTGL